MKWKAPTSPTLSTGLIEIAKSLPAPVQQALVLATNPKVHEIDMSNRMATTATTLVGLEKQLRLSIKDADEGDIEFSTGPKERLIIVQT